jgi:hypothetical protein
MWNILDLLVHWHIYMFRKRLEKIYMLKVKNAFSCSIQVTSVGIPYQKNVVLSCDVIFDKGGVYLEGV